MRSLTAQPVHRNAGLLPAFLLAAGIVSLQALIGGRRLLFAFPGYLLLATAGLSALAQLWRSRARPDSMCLGATGVFCGYIGLRALLSQGYFARPDLFAVAAALVVYGVTATVLTSSRARLLVVASLLAFGLSHVLVGFVQFSRGDNFMLIPFLQRVDYGQRASGFFVCPNHLAGLLEVLGIFGVSLTFWSRWPVWAKLLVGYATGMCYAGLALTGSRGGYLSVLASLIAFALISLVLIRSVSPGRWLKPGGIAIVVVAALILAGGVLIRQNTFLSERAGNIIDRKNVRLDLWRAAIEQWKLQPVVGTGAGTYRFYGRKFRTEQMQHDPIDVHNDYLHLLCEYGLVGMAAFLLFFAGHIRQGWRSVAALCSRGAHGFRSLQSNRVALTIGALGAMAAYTVHSALDFNLHIPANAILLAFVCAIIANPGASRTAQQLPRPLTSIPRVVTALVGVILLIQCSRLLPGEYYAERARTALRDESPATAIFYAEQSLRYERRNPELLLYMGQAMVASAHQSPDAEQRMGFYQAAVTALKEATRLAPLDGTYPLSLAFTYDEMGLFEDAERTFEVARARDPRSLAVAQLYQAHIEERERTAAVERSL